MSNIFYNILSIIVGLFLIGFLISKLKQQRILFLIILGFHALMFIGFGIGGFFVPEKYEFITILAMLAFTITLAIAMLTIYDRSKDPVKPVMRTRKK